MKFCVVVKNIIMWLVTCDTQCVQHNTVQYIFYTWISCNTKFQHVMPNSGGVDLSYTHFSCPNLLSKLDVLYSISFWCTSIKYFSKVSLAEKHATLKSLILLGQS